MSSKIALKPRCYFLKKSSIPSFQLNQRFGQNGNSQILDSNSNISTKESMDLKEYAEKMMKEQRLSSQKLNQLVRNKFD